MHAMVATEMDFEYVNIIPFRILNNLTNIMAI